MKSDQGRAATPQGITQLLSAHSAGDPLALDRLLPLVYPELKRIARRQLAKGKPGATWNTTAVVHEAYLKLVDQTSAQWQDRAHFFAVAARAMRHLLVDQARKRVTQKRGQGRRPVSIDSVPVTIDQQAELALLIDEALTRLEETSARLCRVFECRYFGGLSEQETVEALQLPLRTVQRDWMKAKAFLRYDLAPG
ncbi:MAG: ECF-type sigma factor [Thermoanaerobaculia bacterium]